ncbi:unnamed protein product [Caenorhabditis nigoni]
MKNLIKSSQAIRFKSIGRIVYNMQNTNYRKIYIPFGSNEDVIMKSWDISENLNNDYFQLNVSGKIINFRLSRQHFPIANFHPSDRESVFGSIHNYFLDFFGYTVKYQWIANNYMLYFPQLANLSLILKFWKAGGDKRYIKKLEHTISSSPIMEHIELTFWESIATLNRESKFYQAESIRIFQDNPTVPVNLGCFQGKQTVFTCNQGRISDLSVLVNRWKSGEAFQNLEHLEIIIRRLDLSLNGVLNEIGVKYIDATRTPPTHTLPKVTMKLSKFPYLVQKEILGNMKYSDLFLLSFVSKNIKKLIKSSQITRFRNIGRIVFDMKNTEHPMISIVFGSSVYFIIISSIISEKLKNDYFQLNVSGKSIDFEYVSWHCPALAFDPCDRESVFTSIYNYLIDFFGDTIEYEWITTDHRFFIPRVRHLSLILEFWTTGTDEEIMERFENIISLSPIMKHVKTTNWRPAGTLNPESKCYQAESINICQNNPTIPINLGCFQGRQAFLRCRTCRISDLSVFLKRWKSGEGFQRLEYAKININHSDVPLNGILNEIGVNYIDATKTPPTHTLPKVYFEYDCKPNTDPIISQTYVVRETDNRVASISIQGKTLSFGVWNETEEEFLALLK